MDINILLVIGLEKTRIQISIPKEKDWGKLKEILSFDKKYDEVVTIFVEKPIKFEQSLRIKNWNRVSDTIIATLPDVQYYNLFLMILYLKDL